MTINRGSPIGTRLQRSTLVGFVALLFALPAGATPVTFDFAFSGEALPTVFASYASSATATGSFTVDSSLLANVNNPFQGQFSFNQMSGFTMTVTGAAPGFNNTYTAADYSAPGAGWAFSDNFTSLDFSKQLVGQAVAGGPWGTSDANGTYYGGDFFFYNGAVTDGPPNEYSPTGNTAGYTLQTDNGLEWMHLTSLIAVTPTPLPASTWLMLSGLAGLATFVRRGRSARTRI